jgi:hypothetical protein
MSKKQFGAEMLQDKVTILRVVLQQEGKMAVL